MPDDFRSIQRRAHEATIDLAYAMAVGRSEAECLPEILARPRDGVTPETRELFEALVYSNRRLIRRVLRDTGAAWGGAPASQMDEDHSAPASHADWAQALSED